MLRGSSKLLAKPIFLLIVAGVLFLIVTFRMSAIPLPNNEILLKIAHNLVAKQTPKVKDWHNYKAIYHDARRIGNGEQGRIAQLNSNADHKLEQKLMLEYGYNALLSDTISVFRSIPDMREEGCFNKKYLSKLPTVSIIMPFYNEYFSVLVRTLHSLINRTPSELLQEIILVDDFSDRKFLGKDLDQYVARYFHKVQIVRLPERLGLIRARLIGARKAIGEVLVILDSHVEANQNWLPPLVEPIAFNKRTVVCPLIDRISYINFEYLYEQGGRGGFDWSFRYIELERLPEDLRDTTKPYKNPVMNGGLFAISAQYFWELGGYDEGLDIWGGEQYELSFKIWMCGGQLLNAPCSRIGHLYRNYSYTMPNPRGATNYISKNYKRVAEVWMDEYKNYIYERQKGHYEAIDAGNLTAQKALRAKLNCKSFKWYMEEIAFDLLKANPPIEPTEYAYGAIQNVGSPHLCIDSLNRNIHERAGLHTCARNISNPHSSQMFAFSWRRELRKRNTYTCLDVPDYHKNAFVLQWTCHNQGGSQLWYYDQKKKLLKHGKSGRYCLEASPSNHEVIVNICQNDNLNMQWNFGVVNETALDSIIVI